MHIIAHLDMDAFFAAVEEKNNPQFKGMPIVIGSDPKQGSGRGVVSTANYAARDYGIFSATPIQKAWRLSEQAKQSGKPEAIFLPGNWSAYRNDSRKIMSIIKKYAPIMQQRSVDEAYFDLTKTGSYEKATKVAQTIKSEIRRQLNLTASVGIGPNKLIAKIASEAQKPDGLTVVPDPQVFSFISPLPIRAIPGIGPKMEIKLKKLHIHTVEDLQRYSHQELTNRFGKWGDDLYRKSQGQGSTTFGKSQPAKSISEQRTFFRDKQEAGSVIEKIVSIAENLIERLDEEGFTSFKTVAVIIRFSDFKTTSTAHTLAKPTSSLKDLKHEAMRLLLPYFDQRKNPNNKPIRLVGLRLEKLS